MAQTTAISWTDLSWNPVHGCSIVSTECRNCYAATLSLRYGQTLKPWTPANAAENVLLKPHKLREPFSNAKAWRGLGAAAKAAGRDDGMLVFVNSMSDLFHPQVPDEYIAKVWTVMLRAPRHTFQVLTKRPERMRDVTRRLFVTEDGYGEPVVCVLSGGPMRSPQVLPNVWLGVSVGLRQFVGRADVLRQTPAAVRFISAEPLLGPLIAPMLETEVCEIESQVSGTVDSTWYEPRRDWTHGDDLDLHDIDWLIVGGESGAGHRTMDARWASDLREAADAQGTAFFMKQMGGARPGTAMADLPPDLRVREFPKVPVGA